MFYVAAFFLGWQAGLLKVGIDLHKKHGQEINLGIAPGILAVVFLILGLLI